MLVTTTEVVSALAPLLFIKGGASEVVPAVYPYSLIHLSCAQLSFGNITI